jgi:hypothetical protein
VDERHGLVELALRIRDADGRLLARATMEALWRRRAAPSANGAPTAEAVEPYSDGRVLV